MQNYLEAVTQVIRLLKESNTSCGKLYEHNACYMELFRYMLTENKEFSMSVALEWLKQKKQSIKYETYSCYRRALFRLEHYLLFGDVDAPFCRSEKEFFCNSGMSESFYRLLAELEEHFNVVQNPCYFHTYSTAFKAFFRIATQAGITEPEALTIEIQLQFWKEYVLKVKTDERRSNASCAIQALMKYLYQRGDVPYCYQYVFFNGNADKLENFKVTSTGGAFHPSSVLESKAEEYLAALGDWKFKDSSTSLYRTDFEWYFMFLELNHLEHSEQSMKLWESVVPDYPNQKKENCSLKARRVRTIQAFDRFLNGNQAIAFREEEHPSCYDSLSDWSRTILNDFVESRKQDGMERSTLSMCHCAAGNFFQYLDQNGISDVSGITPEIIKSFHNQSQHATPESTNAYSIKLKQLLQYMADNGMIRQTLVYAVSTAAAPRRTIVDVLSDEEVSHIYDYREKATTPLELRDVAMVMLGLRMGIRGVDIRNLRITDFDWNNKTLTFVQKKTRKEITLPVPTDVGNSVYKYITNGRPSSAEAGNGYVFIRHLAPYTPFSQSSVSCRGALKRILAAYDIKIDPGKGFHMTRKTFATRMLRAENRIDDIANALGHSKKETAEVYLERDEKNMRLCPLTFGGVL